ncbi:uncharacterized protein FMAN_05306 [Fusarium mangiferae]|uniref:Zn(2)-C6 fungal-type domain-containing protein n=1 Tax=Fusarium mangiferae TaxID=192010 RepID=A0A1L7SVE1_FUSMA|nr:uncharacterized protein FMAN_05306 [Fusarium mangiferae]CVK87873.1 uncharacterized protein FMAN_05306 [Fusarium mangiferae]
MADRLPSPPKYAMSHSTYAQGHKQRNDTNSRRQKVLRACDRCRTRKTKCDAGYTTCRRCQRDGFVCTTGFTTKNPYRQLPPGYTEVYKKTHSVLETTIKRLYLMLRNGDTWDFDEPKLDNCGEVIVHDIVHKLGYSQPRIEARSPTPLMDLEDEENSEDTASEHGEEITDQVPQEEALVPETGLPTPCRDEQSPPEQYVDNGDDGSKTSMDHSVGSDNSNTLAQQWTNGFYTDFSTPICGVDMMALNWPQSDLVYQATGETVSGNIPLLFQPAVFNMCGRVDGFNYF